VFPVAATRLATKANPADNASIRAAIPGQIANQALVILMCLDSALGPDSQGFPPIPGIITLPAATAALARAAKAGRSAELASAPTTAAG
jgi:hypothetical protein